MIMRALRAYSGGLPEGCDRITSYPRYGVETTMKSLALSASGRKQLSDARVLEHQDEHNIF